MARDSENDPMELSDLGVDDIIDASGLDPAKTRVDPFDDLERLEIDEVPAPFAFPEPESRELIEKLTERRARVAVVDEDVDAFGDTAPGEAIAAAAPQARSAAAGEAPSAAGGSTLMQPVRDAPAWSSQTLMQPSEDGAADSGDVPTVLLDLPELSNERQTLAGIPAMALEAAARAPQWFITASDAPDAMEAMEVEGAALTEAGVDLDGLSLAPPAHPPTPTMPSLEMPGALPASEVAERSAEAEESGEFLKLDFAIDFPRDDEPLAPPEAVEPPVAMDEAPAPPVAMDDGPSLAGVPTSTSTALLTELPAGVLARARREATPKSNPAKWRRVSYDPEEQVAKARAAKSAAAEQPSGEHKVLGRARVEAKAFGAVVEERNSAAERDHKREIEDLLAAYVAEPVEAPGDDRDAMSLQRKAPGSVDSGGVGARTRTLHDGVIRIRLDSVCGLVVNAFVLRSAERVVLIDAGFPYTADQLLQGLAEVGLEARDVTDLLVTHLHVDHVGGALTLADQWSPRIWVWSGARPAFGDVNAHLERAQRAPDWPNALIHLDAGDATRAERLQAMRAKPLLPLRQPETRVDGTLGDVRPVEHGETITLGPGASRAWMRAGTAPTTPPGSRPSRAGSSAETPSSRSRRRSWLRWATTRGRGGVRWTGSARSTCGCSSRGMGAPRRCGRPR